MLVPLPGAAMLVGERLAVIPLGAPVTDNIIAELNRYWAAVESVICVGRLGATLALVALDVSVKVASTVRLRD